MFNIAKKDLVQEAFGSLVNQINGVANLVSTLANQEREDIKNLTLNFIELKNKIDAPNEDVKKLFGEIERLDKQFEEMRGIVVSMNKVILEMQRNKQIEVETIETPVEILPKVKEEVKIKKPNLVTRETNDTGFCTNCQKLVIMQEKEILTEDDGTKMVIGTCIDCGMKLFKLQ